MPDLPNFPAVETHESSVYFIKDGAVIGEGRIQSWYMGHVIVVPDEAATAAAFADDFALPVLGRVENLRYWMINGQPKPGSFTDEPENRHNGTTIVGKQCFDFGFSPEPFREVPGHGAFFEARMERPVDG